MARMDKNGTSSLKEPASLIRMQAAALVMRDSEDGKQVLMITSLSTRRWILPKGWIEEGETAAAAAIREAYEEAGVKTPAETESAGSFRYMKVDRQGGETECLVQVSRLRDATLLDDWPERKSRKREWVSIDEAAERIEEPELKALLRRFGGSSSGAGQSAA